MFIIRVPQFLFSLFPLSLPNHFGNLVATNFFFFSPIFDNLIATIGFLSSTLLRGTSLLGRVLDNKNFGNPITEIQNFSSFSHHNIYLSSLVLFVRILAMVLLKFPLFPQFPKLL